jgi:hypothetical protein
MSWFDVIRRVIRSAQGRCLVCGRDTTDRCKLHNGFHYCSIECAVYDGTFSVRDGWIAKPSLYRGTCQPMKRL